MATRKPLAGRVFLSEEGHDEYESERCPDNT